MRALLIGAAGAIALGACHSSSPHADPSAPVAAGSSDSVRLASRPVHRSTFVMVADEIMATGRADLYEAIRQVHPAWLRAKGGDAPALFVNGVVQSEGLTGLTRIQLEQVVEVHYYSLVDGRLMFGLQYRGGVVAVTLR